MLLFVVILNCETPSELRGIRGREVGQWGEYLIRRGNQQHKITLRINLYELSGWADTLIQQCFSDRSAKSPSPKTILQKYPHNLSLVIHLIADPSRKLCRHLYHQRETHAAHYAYE